MDKLNYVLAGCIRGFLLGAMLACCGWKDGYPFGERHDYCPSCGARMDLEG